MKTKILFITLVSVLLLTSLVMSKDAKTKDFIAIDQKYENVLLKNDMPYIWKSPTYVLAEWNAEQQNKSVVIGVSFNIIVKDVKDTDIYYIFAIPENKEVPAGWTGKILYRNGSDVVLKITPESAQEWIDKGYHPIRLYHNELRFGIPKHPFVAYSCTYNSIVNDFLSRTSQNQWLEWDRILSGVDTVNIGGTIYSINRRQSANLFNGDVNAKAIDFLIQQATQYHYSSIEQDPYTTAGPTWYNIILTIPGQTTPADIVAIAGHVDDMPSSGIAPAADDNGTTCSDILEAARLLRQFRFQRTIKLIWFTGEEQGEYGSAAYTADHDLTHFLGVISGDEGGYDGNADKCFEMHVGTIAASADVGHCLEDTLTAYSIDLPRHDFLTTNATTQSDMAQFWNHNAGAVCPSENYFSSSGGSLYCTGADPSPYYHTANDTIANDVTLPYAYNIARDIMASIAAMAIPIQACFSTVPTLTATAGTLQVALSWTTVTGASSYRVYRSTNGCYGQWLEQTNTTGTTWTDTSVTAGVTYYYYVEAVASDGFCVSNMSNCASAVPVACTSCASYRTGSNTIVGNPTGGDGDAYPDNCETVSAQVIVDNVGSLVANNVQVTVTPVSNFLTVTTAMPINAGNIPIGGNTNVQFTYTTGTGANKATCMQTGTFNIAVQAQGQPTPDQKQFSYMHEVDVTTGTKTWAFEPASGMEGWTVSSGTWALSTNRVNTGSSTRSVHSSQSLASSCDIMTSPSIQLAPALSSTLTIPNWYAIEQGTTWYDRCNVHIIDLDNGNLRTLVSPASGKLYKTGTFYNDAACTIGTEAGWAGNATADMTWGNSVFNLGTTYAGHNIQIEVKYYTDTSVQGEGVYLDDLSLTNARITGCDAYSDTCPTTGKPGAVLNNLRITKSGTNLNLTWTAPTSPCVPTGYGLYRGTLPWTTYNHASVNCSITSTSTTTIQDTSSYYYLITPYTATAEGSYGTSSSGTQRPQGTTPCKTSQDVNAC